MGVDVLNVSCLTEQSLWSFPVLGEDKNPKLRPKFNFTDFTRLRKILCPGQPEDSRAFHAFV
jgi:hypothetical protein